MKTFQPGVIQLASGKASAVNDTELTVESQDTPIQVGSVITWNDRAYVVESVTKDPGGSTQVSTRPAEFSEVFADLQVNGDLQSQDFDFIRMSATAGDASVLLGSAANSSLQKLTTFNSNPCTAVIGDANLGESSTVSCSVKWSDPPFSYDITSGVRDVLMKNVNVGFLRGKISVGEMKMTPFSRVDLNVLGSNNKPKNSSKTLPIVYVQIPVKETAGFLRLDIPLRLEIDLPLFKFKIGAEVAFPFTSVNDWSMKSSIDTPVATIGGEALFKYEAKAHLYAVSGAELVLAKSLALAPNVNWFKENSPDRLLSVGAFFKGGWNGDLSVNVASLKSKPCFKWNIQGMGGATTDVMRENERVNLLDQMPMLTFGAPVSGSSGCGETGQFWAGSYQLTTCSLGELSHCQLMTYNNNRYPKAPFQFRTGNENLNIRDDVAAAGCMGATSSIPLRPVVGSTWSYNMKSELPFNLYPITDWKFTVTNVTDTTMSGTMSVSFADDPNALPPIVGTTTGVWSVDKKTVSFPKCLPPKPTYQYASSIYSFLCYGGFDVLDIASCDWRPGNSPGRNGEWAGL